MCIEASNQGLVIQAKEIEKISTKKFNWHVQLHLTFCIKILGKELTATKMIWQNQYYYN